MVSKAACQGEMERKNKSCIHNDAVSHLTICKCAMMNRGHKMMPLIKKFDITNDFAS